MENIEVLKSNYSYLSNRNYTAYQMILPLDLEKKIEKNDPVHRFLEVMEGVNWNKYLHKSSHKGRDEYDPFKMIKVILFAYMNQIYSLRINQRYSCEKCEGCSLKMKCTKAKGDRVITVNPVLEEFERTAKNKLDSEKGIYHRMQRSIQTEGAFGIIKEDYGYERFHRRKIKNVEMEFLLVCIGFNLLKYHNKKYRKLAQA